MTDYFCRKCEATENLTILRTNYQNSRKYTYFICRPCNAAQQRLKYAKNPKQINKVNETYRKRNPARAKAWQKALIITAKPCEVCGAIKSQKHHPDPFQPLMVIHLCPLHHRQIHTGRVVEEPVIV